MLLPRWTVASSVEHLSLAQLLLAHHLFSTRGFQLTSNRSKQNALVTASVHAPHLAAATAHLVDTTMTLTAVVLPVDMVVTEAMAETVATTATAALPAAAVGTTMMARGTATQVAPRPVLAARLLTTTLPHAVATRMIIHLQLAAVPAVMEAVLEDTTTTTATELHLLHAAAVDMVVVVTARLVVLRALVLTVAPAVVLELVTMVATSAGTTGDYFWETYRLRVIH